MKTDERIIQLRHFNRTGLADWECATLDNSAALIESQSAEIAVLLSALRQSSDALRFAHPQLDPNSTIFQEVSSKVRCAIEAIEAATQPKPAN